jgi:hypothetical protein
MQWVNIPEYIMADSASGQNTFHTDWSLCISSVPLRKYHDSTWLGNDRFLTDPFQRIYDLTM